jgi:cell division protein FtsB
MINEKGIKELERTNESLLKTNERLHAKIHTLEKQVLFYVNFDVDGLSEMASDLIDALETFRRNVAPVKE